MKAILSFLAASSILVGGVASNGFAYPAITANQNLSKFEKESGSAAEDRDYVCFLSYNDIQSMFSHTSRTNLFYNWITSYEGSGWAHGSEFRNDAQSGDLGSIQELINGTETHIYSGQTGFGKFSMSKLLKDAHGCTKGNGIVLDFYVQYHFWAHDKYGFRCDYQPGG